jgi:ribose transport system permease protein
MPFILLILIGIIAYILLHRSVFGRYLYAVGRNEDAARYSGINSHIIILGTYVVEMLLVAIGGILVAFYTNSISPANHGSSYELYAIAAAVLGGCSLRGGEGSILGIVIGTALLQVLQNLVNLLGIPSSLNFAVKGGRDLPRRARRPGLGPAQEETAGPHSCYYCASTDRNGKVRRPIVYKL